MLKAIQSEPELALKLLRIALSFPECEQPANDDTPQPEDDAILAAYLARRQKKGGSGGD